jgi:hypothetical protein
MCRKDKTIVYKSETIQRLENTFDTMNISKSPATSSIEDWDMLRLKSCPPGANRIFGASIEFHVTSGDKSHPGAGIGS